MKYSAKQMFDRFETFAFCEYIFKSLISEIRTYKRMYDARVCVYMSLPASVI